MPQDSPSRHADQFLVRMPAGLRDRIAVTAKQNGRSMNAEIVSTLEGFYPAEPSVDELLSHLQMFANDELRGFGRSRVLLMHTLKELQAKLEAERETS